MSPRIHDRHSLVNPDGATDDELAEGLLEAQREISQPIPLYQPPDGFLDRIMKRTLQVLEVLVAVILMKALWTRKAFAAGVMGTAAMTGMGVLTLDLLDVNAELPRVESGAQDELSAAELLAQLAVIDSGRQAAHQGIGVAAPEPGPDDVPATAIGAVGLTGAVAPTFDELTSPTRRSKRPGDGVYWAAKNVDRLIARAMRKYGMSLRGKPVDDGGWRCHEGVRLEGGQLAYKYYYDDTTGRTKTVPVRCYRL